LTLAGVVKEVVTCWRSSSLKKKYNLEFEKEKFNLRLKASSYKLQAASLNKNTIK